MKKWIEIANKLETIIGDHFGFGSIMCGLNFHKISDSEIWNKFSNRYSEQAKFFQQSLLVKFTSHANGDNKMYQRSILPFVIQLCHIIECCYLVDSVLLPSFNDNLNVSNKF